jgi:hypothetical protein
MQRRLGIEFDAGFQSKFTAFRLLVLNGCVPKLKTPLCLAQTIRRTMTMILDGNSAKRRALRKNIERYSRLLETVLTAIERTNLHKRMAEDWAVLSQLNQAIASPSEISEESVAGMSESSPIA